MNINHWTAKVRSPLSIIVLLLIAGVVWLSYNWPLVHASPTNGFDIEDALVPREQIIHGGPPRDGIPSVDNPRFVPASQAGFLTENDRVLGVYHNGRAKAYPIRILNYHEIVNDYFGKDVVVVSFCPLCGTGMVFESQVGGVDRTFGVSGLLYNSDMLLYDRESMSLWSQIMAQAISGPLKGARLQSLAASHTSWLDWRNRYPETLVLSEDTGYRRDYQRSPYPGYAQSNHIMFPVNATAAQYHPKELVIGLQIGQSYKAYPFSELAKTSRDKFTDVVNGKRVYVTFNAEHRTGSVYDENNREIPTVIGFWFAWIAFHPESEVYIRDSIRQ